MAIINNKISVLIIVFILSAHFVAGIESWILPIDNVLYRRSEELFLNSRRVAPFEDIPVVAEEIREEVLDALSSEQSQDLLFQGQSLLNELKQRITPISPIVELGFRAYATNEEDIAHYIRKGSQKEFLDYLPLYELHQIPALLKLGFIASSHGFSLLFQPELRSTISDFFETKYTNLPSKINHIDANFPYRGSVSFFHSPIEFRLGREKLQLGPGRISALSTNRQMPYYDYVKGRFFIGWFSFSCYLIRLNPILEPDESDKLENMPPEENPEVNARCESPFSDKAKHLAVHKVLLTPFPWLSVGIAELNMIGGRSPQLSDFNPFTIFHNNFSEGNTNQTLSITMNIVPYYGILLYGEYYLYENVMPNELQTGYKPSASAYQLGLTILSDPFFNTGPGRIRLDAEISYVDPWCYARWYDLKKYTSRIVYVETYDRLWVDYPLGFYLGPDAVQYLISLSYGIPGKWEIICSWKKWGKGAVDLYGWDSESMFPTEGEPGLGLSLTDAPSSLGDKVPYWRDELKLNLEYFPRKNLHISTWFSLEWIKNRYHEKNDNRIYWHIGTNLIWSIF